VAAGDALSVTVKRASARRPKRNSWRFSWTLGSGGLQVITDDDIDEEMNEDVAELALAEAPASEVFLRAIADKTTAVVGEQITVRFYLYYALDGLDRFATDAREPSLRDFLRVSLLRTPDLHRPMRTKVGTKLWYVRLIDRVALFPIRAGELVVEPYAMTFPTRAGNSVERRSDELSIEVTEPSLLGRPAGYRLGDVGNFKLSAEVKPRQVEQGGSVAVLARLEGFGALPTSLPVPQRTGVTWLEPEVKGSLDSQDGRVGGTRSFGFVVRVDDVGEVDLGTLALPYYDPERRSYDSTEVALGKISVSPRAHAEPQGPAADGGPELDPFASLGGPRLELGPYEPRGAARLLPTTFWAGVLGPPLGVLLFGGIWRGVGAWRLRRRARQDHPAVLAAQALSALEREADVLAQAALAERALHLAIEAATGLRSRGVLLGQLQGELSARGLPAVEASRVVGLLERTTALRFEPGQASGAEPLVGPTRAAVQALLGRAAKAPSAVASASGARARPSDQRDERTP
jgi:hypothetical protein